jgi:hypothetical protein
MCCPRKHEDFVEEFPHVMDNKGVIGGNSVKWVTLYTSRNEEQIKSGECIFRLDAGYFISPAQISNITIKIYKFIHLFLIFRRVEVGVTLREDHSFKMFQDIRLRRIFVHLSGRR